MIYSLKYINDKIVSNIFEINEFLKESKFNIKKTESKSIDFGSYKRIFGIQFNREYEMFINDIEEDDFFYLIIGVAKNDLSYIESTFIIKISMSDWRENYLPNLTDATILTNLKNMERDLKNFKYSESDDSDWRTFMSYYHQTIDKNSLIKLRFKRSSSNLRIQCAISNFEYLLKNPYIEIKHHTDITL